MIHPSTPGAGDREGGEPLAKTLGGAPRPECPYCGTAMVAQWNADIAVKRLWDHAEYQCVCEKCRSRGPAVRVPRDGIGEYKAGIVAAELAYAMMRAQP